MDYRPQVITLLLFYLLFIRNVRTLDYYTDDVFESKTHPDVYSPNVYPKFEKAVTINTSLFLEHFGPYDESKSEFVVRLQVHLSWIDERLATNQSIDNNTLIVPFEADAAHLMKLWRPSLYFSNSNPLNPDLLSAKSPGLMMGRIEANGRVNIVKRTTMTGSCKLNIKLYPLDVLKCSIQLESINADRYIHLQWISSTPITMPDEFNWGNFHWIDHILLGRRVSYQHVGPFSRLEAIFVLRRQLGYFLLTTYAPSVLFVISSWTSFWVHIPAAPARVALVLTTMLTHVTSSKAANDKLPRASFIHSLDVWMMVCTMFIFASLVEYATANYYYHKPDRITARNKPAKESTIEMVNETTSNTTSKSPVNRSWTKVLKVIAPPFKSIVPRRTALEIDRKSRFIFPITFILFNVLYWTILLCYSYNSNDQID